ncbi:MAG: tagaturonate reductase [Bacteroidota bacterium]
MLLSRYNLKNISADQVSVPDDAIFELPEKVLQFGTGVLLRGLPDYFIDKANKKGIFNGRIVVVKSTDGGDAAAFDKQDSLYTLCIRGVEKGHEVKENIICSSISRVLSAKQDWNTILACAHNADLQIVISNTTEVGIELVNDDIRRLPPVSYPGKLLAFLHERYKAFQGSAGSGLVIVPTELISENGKKLEAIVLELAHLNSLDEKFIEWLEQHNQFCNSLVDRIVPGKPDAATRSRLQEELGYQDDLLTMSEAYSLWAIEGNEHTKSILSFAAADDSVVIAPDITLFKELKLRLLNGTHTLSCGVAILAGFTTVKEAMADPQMYNFIKGLMKEEIAVAIPYEIPAEQSLDFADKVLDRFSNPNIEHLWLSITLNYTSKLKMRIVQVLKKYVELYDTVPENMVIGLAAYLLFMKPLRKEGNVYFGELSGQAYPINDDKAGLFFAAWKHDQPNEVVNNILSDASLWETDLSRIPTLVEKITEKMEEIRKEGMQSVIKKAINKKSEV